MRQDSAALSWADCVAALLLILITAFLFAPVVTSNDIVMTPKFFVKDYPLRHYWVDNLWKGYPPFLNTAISGGQPILANVDYSVFYPGNVFYFLLPFDDAWNLTIAGHIMWTALGLYWLARGVIRLSSLAAFSGAIAFATGSPLFLVLNEYNVLAAISWVPWICGLAIKSAFHTRWLALLALTLGTQILTGSLTITALTALMLFFIPWLFKNARAKRLIILLIVICTALALSAIQLFPALAWIPETENPGHGFVPNVRVIHCLMFLSLAVSVLIAAATQKICRWKRMVVYLIPILILMIAPFVRAMIPLHERHALQSKPAILPETTADKEISVLYLNESHAESSASHDIAVLHSAIYPFSALRWGVNYNSTHFMHESEWTRSKERRGKILQNFDHQDGLRQMRDSGIDWVVTSTSVQRPGFNPAGSVLIPDRTLQLYKLTEGSTPFIEWEKGSGELSWLKRIPHRIYIRLKTAHEGILKIKRNAVPGWRLQLSSSVEQLPPINGWIRVAVKPGEHEMELTYIPPGLLYGSILSALGTLVLLMVLLTG